jgi:hypothetical protein
MTKPHGTTFHASRLHRDGHPDIGRPFVLTRCTSHSRRDPRHLIRRSSPFRITNSVDWPLRSVVRFVHK